MQIAIVGPGGIGSTFAFQLARAGHDVTVVARGQRLAQLQQDGAIVRVDGERAAVQVSAALDPTKAWDLVLVTVLASQVDVVLPAVAASAARTIMFMFNTFEPLGRLRHAVGSARFAFGFPAILANVAGGKLTTGIVNRGMTTTVTDPAWAQVFSEAGIIASVHPDMESWLRTHAALVVPVMIAAGLSHARDAGITWAEARRLARAMKEGIALVRHVGNTITPAPVAAISRLPVGVLSTMLWTMTRLPVIRTSGAAGFGEPRWLIDEMNAAGPGLVPTLLAVRP